MDTYQGAARKLFVLGFLFEKEDQEASHLVYVCLVLRRVRMFTSVFRYVVLTAL